MKYTFLPPQEAPKGLGAYRHPSTLGEHQLAFLNSNNRFGFQLDDIPDEPIVEEMAALFLLIVYNLPKIVRDRSHESAIHRRKMHNAGYKLQRGVYVKRQPKVENNSEILHSKQCLTPLQEFEAARNDPRWQQPWNHVAYHESLRKHIVSIRSHYSFLVVESNDEKHLALLARLRRASASIQEKTKFCDGE